ncbi:hypothetical protein PQQ75_15920 [Paraburkholderia aspalathi]|uniref:hypothetical protein n=1 Tax=Paraburkholderia aspalathi TaxID=1324617 RepID=UPI0038B76289
MENIVDNGNPSGAEALVASARHVLKGTLVPIKDAGSMDAKAPLRHARARQLSLDTGETEAVREIMKLRTNLDTLATASPPLLSDKTIEIIKRFEGNRRSFARPTIAEVSAISESEMAAFLTGLIYVREQKLKIAQSSNSSSDENWRSFQLLNKAAIAASTSTSSPLGMLNLERIEMVPAGLQRGELVATIPLAPGEETAVTHKEWSVTTKEFTTIVTDSLENTSETGVTDNTDLSQSTTSQNSHSTQFNITATVQGGIPLISGSSTAGVTAQDAGSNSATESIKHATSITQKAASRSRQEHKTTISTTTVTGTSEKSTRILKNTGTQAIRVDYFSIMRKWNVSLYRYGLRLTYDLVIPEPSGSMRSLYKEFQDLKNEQHAFVPKFRLSDIVLDGVNAAGLPDPTGQPKYLWLADQNQAVVPPFPVTPGPITVDTAEAGVLGWSFPVVEVNVPDGAMVKSTSLTALVGKNGGKEYPSLRVLGAEPGFIDQDGIDVQYVPLWRTGTQQPFLQGATGQQKITFWLEKSEMPHLLFNVEFSLVDGAEAKWRNDVWNALYAAAQLKYYAEQDEIAAKIAVLEARINDVDTLTLRREESEEVMKGVLRFIVDGFDLMPDPVKTAFTSLGVDIYHGTGFDETTALTDANAPEWSALWKHEDVVRFINQAIEWENVVTFLYSYFWDVPESWPFIRALRHNDLTRQAFLRAGSARVVLTVRKGWEQKWLKFASTGALDDDDVNRSTGPYLSIAQEIAAYDDRNYPGISPANPGKTASRLEDARYSTSSMKVTASTAPVTLEVDDTSGFTVGLPVIVDVEDDKHVQEAPILTKILDGNHIEVSQLTHLHDGTIRPFPVLQPGYKGVLIAEWNEYTPSSGIDIAVTSNLGGDWLDSEVG